jgi:hypothetical protein
LETVLQLRQLLNGAQGPTSRDALQRFMSMHEELDAAEAEAVTWHETEQKRLTGED